MGEASKGGVSINIQLLLGNRIRQLRLAKGLSQEALAFQCSCYASHIGQIERGEGNPSLDTLCRIADGLDLTVSELLDFDTEFKNNETDEMLCKIVAYVKPLPAYAKKQLMNIVKSFVRALKESKNIQ